MILDASAVVATILGEPDAALYQAAMLGAAVVGMSAASVLEARIVLSSRSGATALQMFDEILAARQIESISVDTAIAALAFDAFRRYGKGQGHRAQLNILDCIAYATAKSRNEPLLFKGDDISHTDIVSALT